MADTTDRDRPHGWQYLRYVYGARLPDSMRAWVARDLTGRWAPLRMVGWWLIPCVLLVLPFLFVPADWFTRITMFAPIPIAFVFFTVALNVVYRRHRLAQHGLDPDLTKHRERERNADLYDEYHRKYRGRV
ncbi:MAG: DUF5313 family protein [Gordonia sp. (in: high G+C Gram-positive bacteria)]